MIIKIADLSIQLLDKLCEIEKHCFEQIAFTKEQLAYLVGYCSTIGITATVNHE